MIFSRGALCVAAGLWCVVASSARPARASIVSPQEPTAEQAPKGPEQLAGAPRVAEIVFEGVDPKDEKGLRSYVEIQEGEPLTGRDVRETVRALHASARFSQVAAYIEVLPVDALPKGWTSGVRLIFVVSPIRKLVAISFPGRQVLPESILHQTVELQVNAEFQPSQVPRAVEAIQLAYRRVGHRRAVVTPVPVEHPEGVALEFRLDEGPALLVAELRFTGKLGLEAEDLASSFKVAEGDVLNLSHLDDGVRAVRERYRKAGRLRARVDEPLVDEISGNKARVTVPVDAGPLVKFHVRGNRSYPDSLLIGRLIADGADDTLDEQRVQELGGHLRRFYVQQGFFNARVAARSLAEHGDQLDLVFSIEEGPALVVEQLRFDGNLAISDEQLAERVFLLLRDNISRDPGLGADSGELAELGVAGRIRPPQPPRTRTDPDKVFEPSLYTRGLKQIEDLYKSQGYLTAVVGPARLERLTVAEGGDLDSAKATPYDPGRLEPLDVPGPPPRAPHGKSKLGPLPPPVLVRVVIPVTEGERAVVSKLLIEGGTEIPAAQLDAALTLHTGRTFSYLAAEEGRIALTQLFTRRGHLYARVEDDETFPPSKPEDEPGTQRVEVRYRIQPGPVVKVGYVEVVGHRRTNEALIRDLLRLFPGDIITPEALDLAQQSLLATGLFFSATLTPRNQSVAEPEKTLQVVLRERPTRELQTSLGFSLADGPRATIQWTQGNLGGRNLTFTALAKANFPIFRYQVESCTSTHPDGTSFAAGEPPVCTQSFDLPNDPLERVIDFGLSIPRLWPLTSAVRVGVDLIHERAVRDSYQLTKYSAQVSGDMTQRRPFTFGLAYELGYQIVNKGQQPLEDALAGVDQSVFRLPEGDFIFGSLRPTFTLDLRDDPGRPRSGFYAIAQADYLRSLTDRGIHVNLIKAQALAAFYVPLPLRASLLSWGRVGRVIQLDSTSETPGDRRFYLGGALTLRGFHEDAVQPQDVREELRRRVEGCQALITGVGCTDSALLVQAGATSEGGNQLMGAGLELRVPFLASAEIAIFYDAGNLWVQPINFFDFKSIVLRDAVGVGLKYATPIGRLAIDLGMNLDPDEALGEPRFAFYFSVNIL